MLPRVEFAVSINARYSGRRKPILRPRMSAIAFGTENSVVGQKIKAEQC